MLANDQLRRKLGIVDTEHDSASLYEDKMFPDGTRVMPFNTIELNAPYTTKRYKDAVLTFVNAGFPIVGIDQISPRLGGRWRLAGKKDQIAKRETMNSYTGLRGNTPEQNEFIEFLLGAAGSPDRDHAREAEACDGDVSEKRGNQDQG